MSANQTEAQAQAATTQAATAQAQADATQAQAAKAQAGAQSDAKRNAAEVDNHYERKTDLMQESDARARATSAPFETESFEAESARDEAGGALTPESFTGLELRAGSHAAGGVPAVVSSVKHAYQEMGAMRGARTLLKVNQKGGFDCPGCAWPDPDDHRALAEFCENGAKAVAEEATLKRVTPEFFARHSIEELGRQSDFWLGKQGRITHPMVLREGATHYEAISWDEAFALLARELNALSSPDEAIFYTSGRTSNEAAFLYQLFVRRFGTNNLPDCSNMCHESSGCALTETIGVGKGTVTLGDFDLADAIFVIGQNPGTNHPRMLTALQKAARNGCQIVHINPLQETGTTRFKHPQEINGVVGQGTALATLFLQVRINGDVALLKGIMKAMLEAEDAAPGTVFDHEFIQQHTVGYETFVDDLRACDWNELIESSGISRAQMQEAAAVAMDSKRTICCWAMGLTQHKNAVANIQEIVNLLLLRGQIGREGAGVCPVRGHSNVQGDRTMGIWERPARDFLDALGREFNFSPPLHHGLDVVESIKAMHEGAAHVFFAMGGNFLSATPDTDYTARALRRCRLTAHVSTKLHRGHLVTGTQALILPCLGRTEHDEQASGPQFVSVENSMGIVHSSRGTLLPASQHLLSEPAIVARLARAVFSDKRPGAAHEYSCTGVQVNQEPKSGRADESDAQRANLANQTVANQALANHAVANHAVANHAVANGADASRANAKNANANGATPSGATTSGATPSGANGVATTSRGDIDWDFLVGDYNRIRERIERVIDGFANFNERIRQPQGFYLPNAARKRVWQTPSGRAQFSVHAAPRHDLKPDQFLMMTIRSHDQYNTTIYGLDDRYRGIYGERRVVLLHPDDIAQADLKSGDVVDLTSHFEGEERVAPHFIVVPYAIPRRCAATYFPETNVLVPVRSVALGSNTPTSKSIVISLRATNAMQSTTN